MSSQQMGLRIASLIFGLVAIFHIVRVFRHTAVTIGSHLVPMGLSWAADRRGRCPLYLDVAAGLRDAITF